LQEIILRTEGRTVFFLSWPTNSYPELLPNIQLGIIESWQAARMRVGSRYTHLSAAANLFQANIALSPSYGLDDRFVARLAGALAT